MKSRGFVAIRSVSLAIALVISSRQRPWRTFRKALSVGGVCSAKKTLSGHFSHRFWTPTGGARRWCARFKPLLRDDQCPCRRPPRRRTARRAANSTQPNWKKSSRTLPKICNSKVKAAGGKGVALSSSMAPESAWQIRPPTKISGLSPKARNRAVAFRRPEFVPASDCRQAHC